MSCRSSSCRWPSGQAAQQARARAARGKTILRTLRQVGSITEETGKDLGEILEGLARNADGRYDEEEKSEDEDEEEGDEDEDE
jgi:hypothetical protein